MSADALLILIDGLKSKDNQYAYACLGQLEEESRRSDAVYRHLDAFAQMLGDSNSYVRTRGMLLIAANARWDADDQLSAILDRCLRLIDDDKPITARQCIQALPEIARHRPDLAERILRALRAANPEKHSAAMRPLILKDIKRALAAVAEAARAQ